jgi:hypothetical protein
MDVRVNAFCHSGSRDASNTNGRLIMPNIIGIRPWTMSMESKQDAQVPQAAWESYLSQ